MLAKQLKDSGEPALFNYIFSVNKPLDSLIHKVWKAHNPKEAIFADVYFKLSFGLVLRARGGPNMVEGGDEDH